MSYYEKNRLDSMSTCAPIVDVENLSCEAFNRVIKRQCISAGSIRRIAKKANVSRISTYVYSVVRRILKQFVCDVIIKAIRIKRNNTVTKSDILYALKLNSKYIFL